MSIILGLDPGKNNFSYALVEFTVKDYYPTVLVSGMLKHPITDIKGDFSLPVSQFLCEVDSLIKEFKVDYIIAERYMNRGKMLGNTSELVNIMLGLLSTLNLPLRLVTSASWKNTFNRVYNLNDFYLELKPIVPHRIDASLIAMYGWGFFSDTKHLECLDGIDYVANQIQRS